MKLNQENITKIRKTLENELLNYDGLEKIKLNIPKSTLEDIIFISNKKSKRKSFAIDFNLLKKLDLSKVSFDCVAISGIDFTDSYGVEINPQTVYEKDLTNTKLAGVKIIGSLNKCYIASANFKKSKGAIINPQKIRNKSLYFTNLEDTHITGSLDNCIITGTNFKGSKGAIIDPQKVWKKDLYQTVLTDTKIVGSFDNCFIFGTNFKGSRGAVIDPQKIYAKDMGYANLEDTHITGSLDDCNIIGANFKGSRGAVITHKYFEKLKLEDKFENDMPNLEDVNIIFQKEKVLKKQIINDQNIK